MPAAAGARDIGADDELVITGTVRIPRGQYADRIVIVDGRVEVQGHVDGVLIAVDAPVRIGPRAVIDGDVISLAQRVTVDRGATLNKDLIWADDKPSVASGARVYGDVRRLDEGDLWFPGAFLVHVGLWLAFTLSSLVLGLGLVWLAPRAADAAFETALERAGPAIAWGLALFVGLPLAAIVAVLTLVGIPLGGILLLALLPLYALGYVTSAYVLGRKLTSAPRRRIAAFLVGWGILRAVAFIPVLGALVWLAATVFGLGLLTVTLWRSRGTPQQRPEPAVTAA